MPKSRPPDRTPEDLFRTSTEILLAIAGAGIDLADPVVLISLQLIGPVISKVIGVDPRAGMENILAIADQVDIDQVRHIIKGAAK